MLAAGPVFRRREAGYSAAVSCVRGLPHIPQPSVSPHGTIWDGIGPAFVFLAYVAIDLLIRVPLLATMSDTLGLAPVPVPVLPTPES